MSCRIINILRKYALFYYPGGKFASSRHVRERGRVRARRRIRPVIPPLGPALERAFSRVPRVVRASVSLLAFFPLGHFYPLPIRLSEQCGTKCKFKTEETKERNKPMQRTA